MAIDPESIAFIEKYQLLYEENPNSKVFAPLSEAYRKAGMIDEAFSVCVRGVKLHPKFAGGLVALARLFLQREQREMAEKNLKKAVEAAPENILALSLRAENLVRLRQPKLALQSYKTLLFLNPDDNRAANAVKKLESLTADEFEEDAFEMKPVQKAVQSWNLADLSVDANKDLNTKEHQTRLIDRFISLADAHLTRNDIARATEVLDEAEQQLGPIPEIQKRRKLLKQPVSQPLQRKDLSRPLSRKEFARKEKIGFLESLLRQIDQRRHRDL